MNHLVWYREAPVHSYDLADWMNQHLELQEINLDGIIWFIWFFLYLHFRRSWWKGIIEVLLHLLSPLQVGEGDGQGLQHLHLLPGDHLLLPPREEEGGEAEHRGAGKSGRRMEVASSTAALTRGLQRARSLLLTCTCS